MLKVPAIRDPKWLAAVRDMDCLICGRTPCDPAHIRIGGGGGMGLKPHDNMVVPLCHEHHRIQHGVGERTFWTTELNNNPDLALRCVRALANQLYLERNINV